MKKKHGEILRGIYQEVPKEYKDALMERKESYASLKEIMRIAINEEGYDEGKKEQYRNLLASGALDQEEDVMNPEIAKKIDDFIDGRVLEEVEKGNLPKIARTEIMKKWRKYERELKKHD
jgi:hypothetical protein